MSDPRVRSRAIAYQGVSVQIFDLGHAGEKRTKDVGGHLSAPEGGRVIGKAGASQGPAGPVACEWSGPVAPLSSAQKRLWFVSQLDGGSPAYNLSVPLRMRGVLDVNRLRTALAGVIERHESLRTVFSESGGVPYQEVRASTEVPLEMIDLMGRNCQDREEFLNEELRRLARLPFDLSRAVVRLALLKVSEDDNILSVTLHHMVADDWSSRIFVRDLESFYRGADQELPTLPIQTRDYAVWERENIASVRETRGDRFWSEHLAGAPTESRIPGKLQLAHEEDSWRGSRIPFDLPASAYKQIRALAKDESCSPFDFLVAAMQALVGRLSAQDDIVIAAPMANRGQSATRHLVGMLVNTVPLRGMFHPELTFREHLRATRAVVEQAKAHQDVPFDRIVDRSGIDRGVSSRPLCQVMLNLLGRPIPVPQLEGLQTTLLGQIDTGAAQYDLALHLENPLGEGLRGWFEYQSSRYDEAWVRSIGERLRTLIESVLDDPDQAVARLDIMPTDERQKLFDFNSTDGDNHTPQRLQDFIRNQVERTPNAVAVSDELEKLTYAELMARAGVVADRLVAYGVGPDAIVGVCADRSVRLVTAMLGVLLADGAYLPIDPTHPVERIRFALDEATVRVVLADSEYIPLAESAAGGIPVLPLAGGGVIETELHSHNPPSDLDLAYVIYTSGSTGRPKGVAVTQRGIVNRLVWMQNAYQLGPDDVVLQKTPYTFDVSVWEFFWPLMFGARLVMARPDGHKDPSYLSEVIRRESVTTIHFVPSMLAVFLEEPTLTACTSLRRVVSSGEVLTTAIANRFRQLNQAELHNLYGPTEASVDVTHWTCRENEPGTTVPIGRPISNINIYVLDSLSQLVPIGTPGDLHIGGIGLARGYVGRPDLTAERFVSDPFAEAADARMYRTGDLARWTPEGHLEFLGRLDHQVKLHGLRIELGEIEAILSDHPAVSEAVVVVREDMGITQKLVGYLVPVLGADLDAAEVREHLALHVPDYMIPCNLMVMPALPLSSSGKLDRKALPAPTRRIRHEPTSGGEAAPTGNTASLREVWGEVLNLAANSILLSDSFFELGGDSMLSMQLRARLRERRLDLDIQEVLRHPRLSVMATHIRPFLEGSQAGTLPFKPAGPSTLPEDAEDAYPVSALQAEMIFHSEFTQDSAVYQVSFDFHLRLPFHEDDFQRTVDYLVERHDILRTRFELAGEEGAFQVVERASKLRVRVTDVRGLDAPEQQKRIDALFDAEQTQPFDLACPPLLRLHVVRRTEDTLDLLVSFHDSIFDGWSAATFLAELLERYLDDLAGHQAIAEPLSLRYRDFILAEKEALRSEEARAYWLRQLDGAVFLRLPRPRLPDLKRAGRSIDVQVDVPQSLMSEVASLAGELGVTTRAILLAAHLATLARTTGASDVLTGLVSAGRPEETDAEKVLGQFLNTVPLRVEVGGSWREFVTRVFEREVDSFPHRRYPVVELQRLHQGKALFETAFNYIHFHVYQRIADRPDWKFLGGQFTDPFHFPLTVNARVDPRTCALAIVANYNDAELDEAQALDFTQNVVAALRAMTSAPDSLCSGWTGASVDSGGTLSVSIG